VNSPHSIELADDPAVPQRDHLLDLDSIARTFSLHLDPRGPVTIGSCRRECVSYRVGRRLRVVYRVEIHGQDHRVVASTFRSRKRSERAFRTATESGVEAGPLRPALHAAEHNVVYRTFPNDRRIEHLAAVADANADLTRSIDRRWTKSRLIDYYPEASAVVRCLDDDGRTIGYAKVHAGDEGQHTFRIQEALWEAARASGLRIARPLAYSMPHRTLMVEAIAGPTIGELSGYELLAGLHAYGVALATLHSLPPVDFAVPVDSALNRLEERSEGMRAVLPDASASVTVFLEELRARWDEAAGDPVPVHGDTNQNNAILQEGRVAFIDFDRATIGPAASDIGNFLGLLRYFRSLGLISSGAESKRTAVFLEGYSSVRSLPAPESLRVHEAAAVAERSFRAITRLHGPALPRVPALLSEALSLLHSGSR
jgi:Ser/Thr protein kinase RdoA (MazF antagonist)